jgi:D-alanyl-D-alanine carboxypeptidase
LVLIGIVLLSLIGFLWYRADWRFRLWNAIRIYPKPELKAVELSGLESISLEKARSSDAWQETMLLINDPHPLPTDFVPTLTEYNGAVMHPEMVEAYVALRDALQEKTGERIYVSADFRTAEDQADILEEKGGDIAADVGHSEHEAGLALDVYVKGYGGMSLLKSKAGRELAHICGEYGFIIRYPEGKEDVTGTPYEPWHLRYVGTPHARIIMESGLTLEEYVDLLEVGVWYEAGEYFIGRFEADALQIPETVWSISPDNTGYYIITAKKG